jgi:hypothetical protein
MTVQNRQLIKDRAIFLRRKGFSYSYIQGEINIPKSTLSDCLKAIPFKPNITTLEGIKNGTSLSAKNRHQRRLERNEKVQNSAVRDIGVVSSRDLWLFGIGLYLGEGTKMIESVRITNSDPRVIRIAVKWFVDVIGLSLNIFSLSLHSYPDNDISSDMKFWSNISGIPTDHFGKTQIDIRTDKHVKRKLPHGTVQLRVLAKGNSEYGVSLHRRIMGWIDAVAGQG